MAQTVVTEVTISAPATQAGINELAAAATQLRDDWYRSATAAASSPEEQHDVVKLYEKISPGTRSREVLELLPAKSQGGSMPKELGLKMRPEKSGDAVNKTSVRAALRVIQTVEGRLVAKGVMKARELDINFAKYDTEGAARYSLTDDARKALDSHLRK